MQPRVGIVNGLYINIRQFPCAFQIQYSFVSDTNLRDRTDTTVTLQFDIAPDVISQSLYLFFWHIEIHRVF